MFRTTITRSLLKKTLLIMLMPVLIIVLLAYYAVSASSTALEDQARAANAAQARLGAAAVREWLQEVERSLEALAADPDMTNWQRTGDSSAAASHLSNLYEHNEDFAMLALVDAQGRLVVGYPKPPDWSAGELTQQPWYQEVAQHWRPLITNASLDSRVDGTDSILLVVPVVSSGDEKRGMIAAQLSSEALGKLVGTLDLGPDRSAALVFRDGAVTVQADQQPALTPPVSGYIETAETPVTEQREPSEPPRVDNSEKRLYGYAYVPDLNLGIEVYQNASDALRSLHDLDYRVIVLSVSLLVLTVIGTFWLALMYERNRLLLQQATDANRELQETSEMAAAVADENARLYETAKAQRYEEQAALLQLSDDLISTLEAEQVLSRAAGISVNLLDADYCAILTTTEDGNLVFRAVRGWEPDRVGMVIPDNPDTCISAAMIEKAPVRINDIATEKRFAMPPWIAQSGLASGLVVPMLLHGDAIGVIMVHTLKQHRFRDEKVRLLSLIANQTAVALENARLYKQEQQHARELVAALQELEDTYRTTLEALSAALDTRDTETKDHSQRVTLYTSVIAKAMNVTHEELVDFERGALLHDVGKIGIRDAILLKPGPLSPEEWLEMKKHPVVGYRMLSKIDFLDKSLPVVLHHHERFDGKGYPFGISGESIPLGARIFAVADALDAMTADRPYRKAMPFAKAKEEIVSGSGRQFDPRVVEAFLSISDQDWESWVAAKAEVINDILPLYTAGRPAVLSK